MNNNTNAPITAGETLMTLLGAKTNCGLMLRGLGELASQQMCVVNKVPFNEKDTEWVELVKDGIETYVMILDSAIELVKETSKGSTKPSAIKESFSVLQLMMDLNIGIVSTLCSTLINPEISKKMNFLESQGYSFEEIKDIMEDETMDNAEVYNLSSMVGSTLGLDININYDIVRKSIINFSGISDSNNDLGDFINSLGDYD